jgi:hypothetical protein
LRSIAGSARLPRWRRSSHQLAGERYVDRILVLYGAKGGVATAWMLSVDPAAGTVEILNRDASSRSLVDGKLLATHRYQPQNHPVIADNLSADQVSIGPIP